MPYESKKQAKFFRACDHGFTPSKGKCPPKSVIREFESESGHVKDRRKVYSKGYRKS